MSRCGFTAARNQTSSSVNDGGAPAIVAIGTMHTVVMSVLNKDYDDGDDDDDDDISDAEIEEEHDDE